MSNYRPSYSRIVCPEGYYGDHCMEPCDCKNDNFLCQPADGCKCKHGYGGNYIIQTRLHVVSYILTNDVLITSVRSEL